MISNVWGLDRACSTSGETSVKFKTGLARISVGWHKPFDEFPDGYQAVLVRPWISFASFRLAHKAIAVSVEEAYPILDVACRLVYTKSLSDVSWLKIEKRARSDPKNGSRCQQVD